MELIRKLKEANTEKELRNLFEEFKDRESEIDLFERKEFLRLYEMKFRAV